MRKLILSLGLVLVVLATSAFGAAQTTICRVTGKTMDQCCCEMKNESSTVRSPKKLTTSAVAK